MRDVNEVRLTGTIESVKEIPLRDGSGSGAKAFIKVTRGSGKTGEDRFSLTAWENVAADLLAIGSGQRVKIEGRLRRDSWTDRTTGDRKFDTSITASSVVAEPATEEVY